MPRTWKLLLKDYKWISAVKWWSMTHCAAVAIAHLRDEGLGKSYQLFSEIERVCKKF